LFIVLDHGHNVSVWQPHFSMATRKSINQEGEQKLQRVYIEEHYEQERGIEHDRDSVPQAISTEKLVLTEPDEKEQREADKKRAEAMHRFRQFIKRLRHFERNDEQSIRKGEHGIA